MKKITSNIILAFIFASQALSMAGCSHHAKVFECKANCKDTTLECKADVRGGELDLD